MADEMDEAHSPVDASERGSSGLIEEILRTHGRIISARQGLLGDASISGAQTVVMNAIAAASAAPTVPRIARSLGHSRQAIQRLVDRLEEQGYLEKRDNPQHVRAKILALSDRGRQLYHEARKQRQAWAASAVRDVPDEELRQAVSVIRRLRHNLELSMKSESTGSTTQTTTE